MTNFHSAMSTQLVANLQSEIGRLRHELQTVSHEDEVPAAGDTVFVADYLLERLAQLGVTQMFGVPGDFNLAFLDYVEDHPKINWVGNCNELNAAYAADGYARVKEGSIGVVTTTFGVGELSAMNGIAGAFSEQVPVLHIAGVPSTSQQKNKPMLHHTLGDGRFDAYFKASQQFTISQATLTDAASAGAEIDRILTDCVVTARPVYLMLPTDLVHTKIPAKRLRTPLNLSLPANDPDTEEFVLDEIMKLVDQANGDVVILVDACAIRHNVKSELADLLKKTGFPVYAAPMGKSVIPETYDRYGGIYIGSISRPEIKENVENAKLLLSVGGLKSDFNTGNFTYHTPTNRTIELHSDNTRVQFASYHGIGMKQLLPKLTARMQPLHLDASAITVPKFISPVPKEDNEIISHAWLWPRVGEFFRSKDVIIAETGTSSFGILETPLPGDAVFLSQILWGSIGWTIGSTLGAALAAREVGLKRTILFVGDGSTQVTVQELSVMMKMGVKPIIFLLNNRGYTVERFLHGQTAKYNDITNWRWTSLLTAFGGIEGETCQSYTVRTKTELDALLNTESFARADKIQFVEMIMEMHDAPKGLKAQAKLSGIPNKNISVGLNTDA